MHCRFDVCGHNVGILSNNHIGRGVVEFEVERPARGFTGHSGDVTSSSAIPGLAEVPMKGDAYEPPHAVTLILSKSEARAIASALMGAAAEL